MPAIEITWINDGKREVPYILTNQQIIRRAILQETMVKGKRVIKIMEVEYTIAKAVKATTAQVAQWREQTSEN